MARLSSATRMASPSGELIGRFLASQCRPPTRRILRLGELVTRETWQRGHRERFE
jgi:hypothetical protein